MYEPMKTAYPGLCKSQSRVQPRHLMAFVHFENLDRGEHVIIDGDVVWHWVTGRDKMTVQRQRFELNIH